MFGLAFAVIGLAVGVVVVVLTLYCENIVLLEDLLCAIAVFAVMTKKFGIHPVFAILAAVAVLAALMLLTIKTKVGFWVVGVLMSAAWAVLAMGISMIIFGEDDVIWYAFFGSVGFLMSLVLHVAVRKKLA
jgi:hypothetical protein